MDDARYYYKIRLNEINIFLNVQVQFIVNQKNVRYSLVGPVWKSAQLLELSTMIHVVRNQIKYILLSTSDRVTFLLLDYVT